MTSSKGATLRDVAAHAGVSIKTASRVLNDDPRVATDTRAAVTASMVTLSYQPDPAARSLRAGRDRTVGVVVESIGDVFVAGLVAQIERVLAEVGYQVLVASSYRERDRERAIVSNFVQRRCAGLIVMPSSHDALQGLPLRDLPVVFVDREGDAPSSQSVVVNDHKLAKEATSHLIAQGHRRIALMSDVLVVDTTRHRHEGYLEALRDAGITPDDRLIRAECIDEPRVFAVLDELLALDAPPTAIFSANTRVSLGIVPALHVAGRTDVAMVAFGDFPMAASLKPAITVIDHSPARIGEVAARTLMARLIESSDQRQGGPVITVPAHLIERGSGEIPAEPPRRKSRNRR
ncbi:LacI family DNA-binding transcriptional regulator [Demequina sediminicola]|uniref:LacI family DNA-binding transcriptional regulator n=1 Tax=Demequina sediminicola TaxID=1095026 RepID=UPI000783B5C0|nr:LacI family DNA-binding transcriptional regulator [Demequina sediminicola]